MNHNIVRKIRLSKLGCYNFKSIKEKELFEFVDKNLLGLKIVKLKGYTYHNFIMYFNNKDIHILQHNLENNYLYVSDELIWSVFKKEFGCNDDEIKHIIKNVMEQMYKIKNILPKIGVHL